MYARRSAYIHGLDRDWHNYNNWSVAVMHRRSVAVGSPLVESSARSVSGTLLLVGNGVFADSLAKIVASQGVEVERTDSQAAAATAGVLQPDLIVLAADAAHGRGERLLAQLHASGSTTPTLVICAAEPGASGTKPGPAHVAYGMQEGSINDCARRVCALVGALTEAASPPTSLQQLADELAKRPTRTPPKAAAPSPAKKTLVGMSAQPAAPPVTQPKAEPATKNTQPTAAAAVTTPAAKVAQPAKTPAVAAARSKSAVPAKSSLGITAPPAAAAPKAAPAKSPAGVRAAEQQVETFDLRETVRPARPIASSELNETVRPASLTTRPNATTSTSSELNETVRPPQPSSDERSTEPSVTARPIKPAMPPRLGTTGTAGTAQSSAGEPAQSAQSGAAKAPRVPSALPTASAPVAKTSSEATPRPPTLKNKPLVANPLPLSAATGAVPAMPKGHAPASSLSAAGGASGQQDQRDAPPRLIEVAPPVAARLGAQPRTTSGTLAGFTPPAAVAAALKQEDLAAERLSASDLQLDTEPPLAQRKQASPQPAAANPPPLAASKPAAGSAPQPRARVANTNNVPDATAASLAAESGTTDAPARRESLRASVIEIELPISEPPAARQPVATTLQLQPMPANRTPALAGLTPSRAPRNPLAPAQQATPNAQAAHASASTTAAIATPTASRAPRYRFDSTPQAATPALVTGAQAAIAQATSSAPALSSSAPNPPSKSGAPSRAPRHPFEPAPFPSQPALSTTAANSQSKSGAPSRAPRHPFEPAPRAEPARSDAPSLTPSGAPRYPFEPAARPVLPSSRTGGASAQSSRAGGAPAHPFQAAAGLDAGARAIASQPLAAQQPAARSHPRAARSDASAPASLAAGPHTDQAPDHAAEPATVSLPSAAKGGKPKAQRPYIPLEQPRAFPEATPSPALLEAPKPKRMGLAWMLGSSIALAAVGGSGFWLYQNYDRSASTLRGNPAAGSLVQTPTLAVAPEPIAPSLTAQPSEALQPPAAPTAPATETTSPAPAGEARATPRRPEAQPEAPDLSLRTGRARALVDEGSAMLRQGRLGLAEGKYMKALQEVPEYPAALAELVRVHLARRDGTEAVRWAQRLIGQQDNALHQLLLGDAFALRGNSDAAEAAWTKSASGGNKTARERLAAAGDDDEE